MHGSGFVLVPVWLQSLDGGLFARFWTINGRPDTARREFTEETGLVAEGEFVELGSVRQKSGKVVTAWAVEGDCDPAELVSHTCRIE